MRRTRNYWRSKYFLEGITLSEFWEHLRPKGKISLVFITPDVVAPIGEVLKSERTRTVTDSEFEDIYLKRSNGRWICALLRQKIKVEEGGVSFKPKAIGGWTEHSVIRLVFEKNFEL
jgi:hypothetical protein